MTPLTKICFLFSLIVTTSLVAQEVPAAKKEEATTKPVVKTESGMELKTFIDKASYAIGTDLGQKIKRETVPLNVEALIEGIKNATAGKKSKLTDDQVREAFAALQKESQKAMKESQKAMIDKRLETRAKETAAEKAEFEKNGAKDYPKEFNYLEENKKKKGVTVTKSGLQYEVLKSGKGATPTKYDKVLTHYHGTFIDGSVFDSSVKRGEPISFLAAEVVSGWTEVLQLMKEGDKWRVTLPPYLAYGKAGRSGIPKNAVLIFEMELIQVGDKPVEKKMKEVEKVDPNIKKEG